MIYSKTSEYAIRSLIFFADHPKKKSATVKEVSRSTGVPQAYVAKIFQCLTQCGILSSQRGPSGGYTPVIPVAKLPLIRVVQAVDDRSCSPFSLCVMGLDKCNDVNPCPLHDIWSKTKDRMLDRLASCTIGDVAGLGRRFRTGRHRRQLLSSNMRKVFSFQ